MFGIATILSTMQELEGFDVEEAKLKYKSREKLGRGAFCGPNRTYPAHDKPRVRNAFVRLSQFGHRMTPAQRNRIHSCLKGRAKKMGIEHSGCWICKPKKKTEEVFEWLIKNYGEK